MARNTLFPVFVVLFFASCVFAQRQSGAMEGTVQDIDGHPVPGAAVTVSSPSLIGGTSNTDTDRSGYYRFPVLASGIYEAKAEMKGFQTIIRKDIGVSVGSKTTVDFSLDITSLSEVVEVTGTPPLIDVSTTAVSFTIPPKIIRSLPKIQNIEFLLALTPGVSDRLVAYGADGPKAIGVWADGVNVGDTFNGELIVQYDYNWIDEVQVTGIGAPAEYGGFTGVVGNFITRSGGNQFHGDFETFFQNQDFAGTNVPDPQPKVPFKSYDVSAQLGGPILRDKLWFFAGLDFPHIETHPFLYSGVTTDTYAKYIAKLTYKINKDNTFQGFAHRNDHNAEGNGGGAYTLPEATITNHAPQSSWNASWISLLSSQTTFEGRLGGISHHYKDIEDQPNLSSHYDLATGIESVNAHLRSDHRQQRYQANAALSHHAGDFLGKGHDFRFGAEIERSTSNIVDSYNGGLAYFDYNGAPYQRILVDPRIFDESTHRVSAYAQDEWSVTDRLSLSLGVRWDSNRGSTDRGVVLSTDPVAPRIGFVWMLDRNSQTVIKAHYGDYYEELLARDYYFLTDDLNFITFQAIDAGGQWHDISRSAVNVTHSDATLKQPYVRQSTVGIDRVLPGGVPFGVHYIYRKWGNILEDIGLNTFEPVPFVNPITGETITVYNRVEPSAEYFLTNPPGLYRRYDAVEFFASKQLNHGLSLSGSLVWSKLRGNSPGDIGFGGANTPFLDDPNTLINFPGRLTNDPTIAWKIVGAYALPWGFNTGFYFRHSTGNTWTPVVRVPGLTYTPKVIILLEPAGSRRLPSTNQLDMRIEKEFPLNRGQLRFAIDIFNVFNNANVLAVQNRFGVSGFGTPIAFNDPRQIRIGAGYSF